MVATVIHKVFLPELFSWGKTFLAFLCLDRLPGLEHLWFVQTILLCYLVLPLFLMLKDSLLSCKPSKAVLGIIFVFLMLQFVGVSFKGYAMAPNKVTCFAVGILFAGMIQKGKKLIKPTIIFSCLAIFMNTFRIYLRYFRGIKAKESQLIDLFVDYAHGVLGIALFLLMYLLFKNSKKCVLLRLSDKYSYYIYLVHQIFILGPLSLMSLTELTIANIVIICCSILLSAFILWCVSGFVFRCLDKCKRLL